MTQASTASNPALVTELRQHLQGQVLGAEDAGYALARRMWNGAIDQRPSAIALCADAEDVALALRIATEFGSEVTVRGGGHNVAGRSIRDGALLIDLARLRSIVVNPEARIASAQGGALWAHVDEATAPFGLATTGGLVSSTGVGGFTLGGGVGWLMRRCGLACDNLLGATIVLADGRALRASENEHPDLLWALRGGAGGLGVVTSFDFRLHPVREVLAGLVVRPAEQAATALRSFRDYATEAPDEFCGLTVLANAPPLPFLDAAWHGRPVVIQALCWSGDLEQGNRELAPLTETPKPLALHLGPMPYVQWQKMQDPAAPPGRCNYWKTANLATLSDTVIRDLSVAAFDLPTPFSEIHVQHLGGAVARVATDHTAFGSRDARYFVNILGIAPNQDGLAEARDNARALHARLAPAALPSTMPNFTDRDDGDAAMRAGANHADRLARVRQRYDPTALFAPR